MGWETGTHRRRRVAGLLTRDKIALGGASFDLPYCGVSTPFASDYVVSSWAPFALNRIANLFPGWFVDVGANIGQTMLQVKHFSPELPYAGFEPNPLSYFVCRQLVAANRLSGCTLVPSGLADSSGVLELLSNSDTDPSSTVIGGFRDPGWMKKSSFVTVVVGDDALSGIGCQKAGVIKIDVEGAELEVISGLRKTIAKDRPLIVCEVLALHHEKSTGDFRLKRQRSLELVLVELGYKIYRIELPVTLRAVVEVPDDRRNDWTDYLFVPSERCPELEGIARQEGLEVFGLR